jgi:crotonobetainyl-CoA:carnitine CoA-transferase CaiB-like acyl-CoA transferase
MRSPLRMSKSNVPLRAAPLLGADTEAVLADELGLDSEALAELRTAGAIA